MNQDREKDKLVERRNRINDQIVAVKAHLKSLNANLSETDTKLKDLGVVFKEPEALAKEPKPKRERVSLIKNTGVKPPKSASKKTKG
jgi:uncharacterized coiled-coil DUF342 family protein